MVESDTSPDATISPQDRPQEAVASQLPADGSSFKDRRAGLVVFGIFQLLIALACLGIAVLQIVLYLGAETFALEGTASSATALGLSAAFYLLIGGGAAWLGIGSIRCRRWARAATLVLSSVALAGGVLGSVLILSILRPLTALMESEAGGDEAAIPLLIGCTLVIAALFYLIIPAAFVLFYRSRHVKATCEHYDPKPRWTDRYPLPVLAGALMLLSTSSLLVAPLVGSPMPFFGALVTGAAAWLLALVMAALSLVVLWGFLRRERWAWLGAVVLMTANSLSAFLTFRGEGLVRMYEAMGIAPDQLDEIRALGLFSGLPLMMALAMLALLAFYLWLGRYFGRDARRVPASPPGGATSGPG